jgi:hypothetical protein
LKVDLREDALSAYRISEDILSIEYDDILTKIYYNQKCVCRFRL